MSLKKESINKLKIIEEHFFEIYPKGFEDEGLAQIVKRHNVAKLTSFAQEVFAKEKFTNPQQIVEDMTKIVSRSSLISLFEKPKFRDAMKAMSTERKDILCIGLEEMLHGSFKNGFNIVLEILTEEKLAKWSLISVIPYYFAPKKHIFIKPTTTKNVLIYFAIEEIVYKPRPSYEFYRDYKKILAGFKKEVNKKLSNDNAKFTGFLMMGMEAMKDE
jgi:hypothetical protein